MQRPTNLEMEVTPFVNKVQMFGFSFGIPKGHVYYKNYKAVSYYQKLNWFMIYI